MLRQVAAFCRPLRPVLLLVSFGVPPPRDQEARVPDAPPHRLIFFLGPEKYTFVTQKQAPFCTFCTWSGVRTRPAPSGRQRRRSCPPIRRYVRADRGLGGAFILWVAAPCDSWIFVWNDSPQFGRSILRFAGQGYDPLPRKLAFCRQPTNNWGTYPTEATRNECVVGVSMRWCQSREEQCWAKAFVQKTTCNNSNELLTNCRVLCVYLSVSMSHSIGCRDFAAASQETHSLCSKPAAARHSPPSRVTDHQPLQPLIVLVYKPPAYGLLTPPAAPTASHSFSSPFVFAGSPHGQMFDSQRLNAFAPSLPEDRNWWRPKPEPTRASAE